MIAEITTIWTEVITWLVESVNAMTPLFYLDNKLTFIGTLCVVGLAVAVALLIFNIVKSFLKLR